MNGKILGEFALWLQYETLIKKFAKGAFVWTRAMAEILIKLSGSKMAGASLESSTENRFYFTIANLFSAKITEIYCKKFRLPVHIPIIKLNICMFFQSSDFFPDFSNCVSTNFFKFLQIFCGFDKLKRSRTWLSFLKGCVPIKFVLCNSSCGCELMNCLLGWEKGGEKVKKKSFEFLGGY